MLGKHRAGGKPRRFMVYCGIGHRSARIAGRWQVPARGWRRGSGRLSCAYRTSLVKRHAGLRHASIATPRSESPKLLGQAVPTLTQIWVRSHLFLGIRLRIVHLMHIGRSDDRSQQPLKDAKVSRVLADI